MCIRTGRQARDGGSESLYTDRAAIEIQEEKEREFRRAKFETPPVSFLEQGRAAILDVVGDTPIGTHSAVSVHSTGQGHAARHADT